MRSSSLIAAVVAAALCTCGVPDAAEAQSPVCVALTLPSVQGVDGPATSFGSGVRDLFVSFLTGPSIKPMLLESRLPSQAALEAQQKGCGQVLLASVTRKHSGGGSATGSILGRAAGIAATRTPIGGGVVGSIASSATWASGEAIYMFASQVRAKDEIELAYRVGPPESVETARPVTSKAKARTDGEDVLTPLVEKAASRIVTSATAGAR
jgi:hypothetical protein